MNAILTIFRTEPTVAIGAVGGLIDAAIILAVDFGAHITGNEVVGINGVIAALGAVVTLFAIRSQVTPNASVPTVNPSPFAAPKQ